MAAGIQENEQTRSVNKVPLTLSLEVLEFPLVHHAIEAVAHVHAQIAQRLLLNSEQVALQQQQGSS